MIKIRRHRLKLTVVMSIALLIGLRLVFAERHLGYVGPRAIIDSLFAIGLVAVMLLIALGAGMRFQRMLGVDAALRPLEQVLFGIPLGLGAIAGGVYVLGLAELLVPVAIVLWVLAAALFSLGELSRIERPGSRLAFGKLSSWRSLDTWKRLILAALAVIFVLSLGQALSPPTDPDGLIDHLAVPKLFLEAGRLFPVHDFVFANYPLTLELLFAVGMAFGSDTAGKLIHLAYAALLVFATFMLGNRVFAKGTGWFAVAIMVGMPIFPLWASLAYVDMGWAVYAFLMVYALVVWSDDGSSRALVLAGLMAGLALGTKYLAIGGAGAAGIWILWHSRRLGGKVALGSAVTFGVSALFVGGPWYLRNLLWFGNPVYPYFSPNSSSLIANYEGFGIVDYLMLPINLYLKRELFVGVHGSIEFPSIFFLLAFLYPFTIRSRAGDAIAGLTFLRYLVWSTISHWRFRYLLPAMPGISLLSAHVIATFMSRHSDRRWPRVAISGLIGGMLAATVAYSALFFAAVKPWRVIVGIESKASYLRRELPDYAAKEFIQSSLPSEARVFMPWNARAYYCDTRCLPDWLRTGWEDLIAPEATANSVATQLKAMNVSHILLSTVDVDYSVLNARSGVSLAALEFLLDEFRPICTNEVYRDEWTTVLELEC
jgi:4-amino-4-deoxy-L-arabinose transferase-like glycosyltransferase